MVIMWLGRQKRSRWGSAVGRVVVQVAAELAERLGVSPSTQPDHLATQQVYCPTTSTQLVVDGQDPAACLGQYVAVQVIQWNPGILVGVTFRQWLAMLRDNHFFVDQPFWPRAALITASSFFNSMAGICENLVFSRSIERTTVEPPIFVLGIWRSGTTLLQNLLCVDPRFGYQRNRYPNLSEALRDRLAQE